MWSIEFIFPMQCIITAAAALYFRHQFRWPWGLLWMLAIGVLEWGTLCTLDWFLSEPDAQGALGPLLFFPLMTLLAMTAAGATLWVFSDVGT